MLVGHVRIQLRWIECNDNAFASAVCVREGLLDLYFASGVIDEENVVRHAKHVVQNAARY